MGRLLDTYRAQKGQPQKEGESEQQKSPSPKGKRLLRSLSVIVATLLITTCVMGLYILTAPVIEAPQEPAKLHFHDRSALRKRPSLESAPIAYTKKGTRLQILHTEGDWMQVRIEGVIKGWTQRDQGIVIPPPPPRLTARQRAKQRLLNLLNKPRGLF